MAKKCKTPENLKYGFGQGPHPIQVPPGECRQLFAFNVPDGVSIVVKRVEKVCDVKVTGALCGPCGPLEMTSCCSQVNLNNEGCFELCILNPDDADLSKMVVMCYEAKEPEAQPGSGMAALSVSDVKTIVEGCLAAAMVRIEQLEAKTEALMEKDMELMSKNDEQDASIATLQTCVDELSSVG